MPYYVYVIELDSEVRTEPGWLRANPDQKTSDCFYVGQTSHSPECRFNQHVTTYGDPCECICEMKPGEQVSHFVVGRAKFAKDYSVKLKPDLFDHLNPFESEIASKEAEGGLTLLLRDEGHGAYSK